MSEPTEFSPRQSGRIPSGTRLSDLYEIDGHIATGGMGEVYRGHAIETGDQVAIKTIRPEMAQNPAALGLFRKEASALHNLYHQAIVRYFVFTVDKTLGLPYLAMEYVSGESLSERIAHGSLAFEELRVLQVRLADGMQAAHELGIVHRDVSPDNVILPDGQLKRAKIIDFGIARSPLGEGTIIGDGFAGKLSYVSPEQLGLYGGDVTGRSDIYSLGLVLAEASLGRRLDMGQNHAEVIERRRTIPDLTAIDSRLRPLIRSMLQPDPKDRPASMAEVAAWTPVALPPPKPSRKPVAALAAAAMIVLLLGGGAVFVLPSLIGSDTPPVPTGPVLSELPPGPPIVTLPPYVPPAAKPSDVTQPLPTTPDPVVSAPPAPASRPASSTPATSTAVLPSTPPPLASSNSSLPSTMPPGAAIPSPAPRPYPSPPDTASNANPRPPAEPPRAGAPPADRPSPSEPPPVQLAAPAVPAAPALPTSPRGPTMERVASYVRDYRGGSCFYLSPISISGREAMIEGLGSAAAPFVQFDSSFREALGFDPTIQLRQINAEQCAVVDAMAVQAGQKSARVPKLRITPDLLRSGDELSGVVDVWPDAQLDLVLVGDDGLAYTVSSYAKRTGASATFSIRIEATGTKGQVKPQLVIAVAGSKPLPLLKKAQGVPAERLFRDIQAEIGRAGSDTAMAVRYFKLTL